MFEKSVKQAEVVSNNALELRAAHTITNFSLKIKLATKLESIQSKA
jgi:hypothetical protein